MTSRVTVFLNHACRGVSQEAPSDEEPYLLGINRPSEPGQATIALFGTSERWTHAFAWHIETCIDCDVDAFEETLRH